MGSFWTKPTEEVLKDLDVNVSKGLNRDEAEKRIGVYGKNTLEESKGNQPIIIFLNQFKSPISLILIFATILSIFLGDYIDAAIIFIIIFLSGVLSFWQEYNAGNAVQELRNMVKINVEVLREGQYLEIPIEGVVPGDILSLTTGDMIPADGLVLESNELNIDESTLTGETFPVEKEVAVVKEETPLAKRENSLWMGTHVSSG